MFWAGPIVGSYLAMMGADVIHVESAQRPDGMRFMSAKAPTDDEWWEWCPLFMAGNTNKRGVTLDLQTERGRALARDLVAHCDVVVENFSPRVMDDLGLGYDDLRAVNPDLVMVRMPAFGLSGPWRDRTGYAQTQEQVSGMAFVTGWDDREPMIPNGPCDPLAGIHATVGLLVALEHRRRTGEGVLVEVPMVGGALNVTAELVVEYDAYANLVTRMGNRSPLYAPQNLYLTADADPDGRRDSWVAVSIATEEHWDALRRALGDPEWARDPALARVEGRREAHDLLDEHLGAWCATRSTDEIVATLWDAGVPVGAAVRAFELEGVEQLRARGYFESLEHPIVGEARFQGFPTRYEHGPRQLHRRPSPTLGQHNDEVLSGLLGLGSEELAELRAAKVIGERLGGNAR
jgi:crotonobetainyl-CoA:carnitine CoA-transferase CaiB-like acyl-CoA transferase